MKIISCTDRVQTKNDDILREYLWIDVQYGQHSGTYMICSQDTFGNCVIWVTLVMKYVLEYGISKLIKILFG